MNPQILNFKFQILNFKNAAAALVLPVLLIALMTTWPARAQNAENPSTTDSVNVSGEPSPPSSARPQWRIRSSQGEGDLIELDDVQIHGEIAQPNVAITISRAEPQFRKISLDHVASESATADDLDLSGLRGHVPPAERIRNWREILNRPRQ